MSAARRWGLIGGVLLTAALAYLARDAVREFVVLPIAYVLWQLRWLLAGVADLILWSLLIAAAGLVMLWQLIPRIAPQGRHGTRLRPRAGPVNETAITLFRARSSNYFRWQLAHRLGRAARDLGGTSATGSWIARAPANIAEFLDAGTNQSFVDYTARRFPFVRPSAGALGVDPGEVIQFLESCLTHGGNDAKSG